MMHKTGFIFIAAFMMLVMQANVYAEVAVIVNSANSVSSLSQIEVKRLFLGKLKNFPGGGSVAPVDQKPGATRDQFYNNVVGKNAAQLKSYWSTQIFSGKGTPPKEVGDASAVKAWVSSNPDAIGYVDSSTIDSSVKVVAKF